jgi:hypothetical protein
MLMTVYLYVHKALDTIFLTLRRAGLKRWNHAPSSGITQSSWSLHQAFQEPSLSKLYAMAKMKKKITRRPYPHDGKL